MKAKRLLGKRLLFPALCVGMVAMYGCRVDVDLKNIDTTAELDFGLALPIGSMNVTLGDLLGSGTVDNLYYSSDGTLCLRGNYTKQETFHSLDLSKKISNAEKRIPLYDEYNAALQSSVRPTSFSVTMPISLEYNGINNDVDYERVDSAYISCAEVEGYLLAQNNLPIPFSWIDKITLEFGKEFVLDGDNSYVLYAKGSPSAPANADYGTMLPISLDRFLLDLVKDHNLPPSNENVVNNSEMHVRVDITLPEGAPSNNLDPNMSVVFGMNVKFISYDAIWGMFEASKHMYDEDEIDMDSVFSNWDLFRDMRLPLAEPSIHMEVHHQLAGSVFFYGDYLYVRSHNGGAQYAVFGADESRSIRYPKEVSSNIEDMYASHIWLDAGKTSTIADSITFDIVLDENPENGHIDQLFTIQPDYIGWSFHVDIDPEVLPQTRITPNTDVLVNVDVDIPFVLNEGTYLTYKDTLPNLNLNSINLDSLSSGYVDSITHGDVFLKVQVENTLPLDLRLVLRCLDANGKVMVDSVTNEPLRLSENDTILAVAPTFKKEGESFVIAKAGTTSELLRITKEQFEDFDAIKSITFEVVLDDRSLHTTFSENYPDFKVRITEDSKLKIGLGAGAQAGVVLNLSNNE